MEEILKDYIVRTELNLNTATLSRVQLDIDKIKLLNVNEIQNAKKICMNIIEQLAASSINFFYGSMYNVEKTKVDNFFGNIAEGDRILQFEVNEVYEDEMGVGSYEALIKIKAGEVGLLTHMGRFLFETNFVNSLSEEMKIQKALKELKEEVDDNEGNRSI